MMAAEIWFPACGTTCYVGAGKDGLEWRRHSWLCKPGLYAVGVTGWPLFCSAVVDDFGNLTPVHA